MIGETERFEAQRGRLTGLAYRMLGSRADAEDVLQDAWLKWSKAERESIKNDQAYLVTIVTHLCLDKLKSARAKREVYVGPWLPEPVTDAAALGPDAGGALADDLSYALLLALERLSPLERAAFLLHDVFAAPFSEIAVTLERSQAAVRQLAARARKAVRDAKPTRPAAPPEAHEKLLAAFMAAVIQGDEAGLKALLRADAIALTDGGGVKSAALKPIHGADRVARLFIGLARKYGDWAASTSLAQRWINGAPGLLISINGVLEQTLTLEVDGDRIAAVYVVRNPEKLARLVS